MRITKKSLLQFLKEETYVRVRQSKIHGVGIFAIRDIPKGVNPLKSHFTPRYFKFTREELSSVPKEVHEMLYAYSAEEDGIIYVSEYGLNPLEMRDFLNHSDNPNIVTDDGGTFVTLRDIKKGEELMSDYQTYDEAYGVHYKEYRDT